VLCGELRHAWLREGSGDIEALRSAAWLVEIKQVNPSLFLLYKLQNFVKNDPKGDFKARLMSRLRHQFCQI
jgi:hypothetical protein